MKFIKNNSYLLLVVAVCILFTLIGLSKMSNDMEFDKVVVVEGDTLWAYSLKYATGNIPNDKWIKDIDNPEQFNIDYHKGWRRVETTKDPL